MVNTRCSYAGPNGILYDELFPHERIAIAGYMELCDLSELDRIIREPPESHYGLKSQGMRDFIADMVTGRLKRNSRQKASTNLRDLEIALEIDDLMFYGPDDLIFDGRDGYTLTSNSRQAGAAAIVADRYRVSEDTAIKAYTKYRHIAKTPK